LRRDMRGGAERLCRSGREIVVGMTAAPH